MSIFTHELIKYNFKLIQITYFGANAVYDHENAVR